MKSIITNVLVLLALMSGAQRALAQDYSLEAFNLDLGGGSSNGGGFAVSGIIAPSEGAMMSGGAFSLEGEFLSLTPGASAEVEPTIIFDNTTGGANGGFGVSATAWLASRFCLGPQSYGLNSVSLLLNSQDFSGAAGPPSLVQLQIYASDPATGKPSTNVGLTMTLSSHSNPVSLFRGQELVRWTNAAPFRLVANTCYWAVLSGENGKRLGQISSSTHPTGDAGSFGATSSANAGAAWGTPTESSNNKMLIEGTPMADPQPLAITSVSIAGNDLRISFFAQSGRRYTIESRTDVALGAWASLPGGPYLGAGASFQITIPNPFNQPQQFYRVKELP